MTTTDEVRKKPSGLWGYHTDLVRLVERISDGAINQPDAALVKAALDGGAARALREHVNLEVRRTAGAFFTGADLAHLAWTKISQSIDRHSRILDPACGAGSLLLPAVQSLVRRGNDCTVISQMVRGIDLDPSFAAVAETRLRLAVLSARQGGPDALRHGTASFPFVQEGDVMHSAAAIKDASHILLNPPFNYVNMDSSGGWSSGRTSNAAAIVDSVLRDSSPGTRIVTILPDVLRSGTRYAKWRRHISTHASVDDVDVWGRFDSEANVDVFILTITRDDGSHKSEWTVRASSNSEQRLEGRQEQLGHHFEITVGAVVPHRHSESGSERAYVTARSLPLEGVVRKIGTRRRFAGTCHQPPFVLVRRTSSPGQRPRARAIVVTGKRPVAVENHLLVLRPLDGEMEACLRAVELLSLPETSDWLDARFRCRHLPIHSLRDLPWH